MQNYKGLGSVSLLAITEVRILFSHRNWETGVLFPLNVYISNSKLHINDSHLFCVFICILAFLYLKDIQVYFLIF